jgi:hypothetical protein
MKKEKKQAIKEFAKMLPHLIIFGFIHIADQIR